MSKTLSKKRIERRKKPRGKGSGSGSKGRGAGASSSRHKGLAGQQCFHCRKDLKTAERALFVEEEVARIFCSEDCITAFFAPEVEALEREYLDQVGPNDLPAERREELGYLRWITLEEPDEVWRQKTPSGDYRYTLISEFKPSNRSVWYVCICLFLKGEASFLYIAFPTLSKTLADHYRRGERIEAPHVARPAPQEEAEAPVAEEPMVDGLADAWTDDETVRAEIVRSRSANDIPREEFQLYQACIEETLEEPDEIWSMPTRGAGSKRVFHFIRHYPDEKPEVWYIIVARETGVEEQIEVVDAFPTRDSQYVERFRKGEQELGKAGAPAPSRVVH